jgi:O-antigen ligase
MNIFSKKNMPKFNIENTLLLFWLLILLTLNINSSNLYDKFDTKNIINYKNIILATNYIRYFIPFLLLPILSYKFLLLKKENTFVNLFALYGLWQLIIFIIINKNIENYDEFLIIFNLIIVLLIFDLANYYDYKKFFNKAFFLIILFISVVSVFFTFTLLSEFILDHNMLYLYSSNSLEAESKTLEQANPRVTGISRMLLILFYFIFFLKVKSRKNKLLLLILFFISCLIYAMQSRGGLIGIFLLFLIYIFFIKEELKKKIFIIFIIFLLPILFWETIRTFKLYYYKEYKENELIDKSYNFTKNNRLSNSIKVGINDDVSSGRIIIWKRAAKIIIEEKIFFGLGPQADRRHLVEEKFKKDKDKYFWQNNSSNALIYSYLCGGFIGLLLMLSIYWLITKQVFKIFIKKGKFSKSSLEVQFASTTITYLTIRTIFENGYGLFSLDFCFCCLCYFILIRNNKLKKISSS